MYRQRKVSVGKLEGNGELGDLRWVALDECKKLPLAPITDLVLELLAHLLSTPAAQPEENALYRRLVGRELIEFHRPTLNAE